jgi:uncharacterized protein (TIGR01777 family)
MRVLITGATGFIGRLVCARLAEQGHDLVVLSRDPDRARERLHGVVAAHAWRATEGPPPGEAVANLDAVVHLAGVSVVGRWTEAHRRAIHDSRVDGTRNLVAALAMAPTPPKVMVSASAIGYYGDRGDAVLDEEAPPGEDFLAEVCKGWEAEAREAEQLGMRVVRLRFGIVLGDTGGALETMLLPARLGLGGPLGSGRQWWSWVHIDDVLGLIEHGLDQDVSVALNVTSPGPVRQRDFARALGAVLNRPAFLPTPAFALKLVLGGFASELLGSKRVLPESTLATGYTFRFPDLREALEDLLR